MRRSTLWQILLFCAFSFLLGFSYNYHLPKIESFLLVETEHLSSEHTPVRVFAQKLHFHLLPLGIVLDDVKILPQPPLDKYLAPASLKVVGLRLAIWPLLRGKVRLSQVYIGNSEFNIFLKNELFKSKGGPPHFKLDFERLYSLPIDEISLENVQLQGRVDPQNLVFRVSDLNLLIENRYQSIYVETNAPRVLVKPSGPVTPLNAQLELRALIEADEMQISAFKLKADDSFVVASGRFNGDFTRGRFDNGALNARAKLRLDDLNRWENVFALKPSLPALTGRTEFDLDIEAQKDQRYKIEADVGAKDLKIDKYVVGQIEGHLSSDLKTLTSKSLKVSNNAGLVELNNLKISLNAKPDFSTDVKVHNLEVHQLLENLDVQHVPIVVPAHGEGSCQGAWTDAPQINCVGKVIADHVHVDSGRPKFSTIVEADDARVTGQASVGLQQVEYKAEIEVGKNSKGRSDGVINYDTGFKINYQGDQLDFKDVKNLVDLKFEGSLKVAGNTQGTAKWATIDMTAEGKDLWLEDYPLGQFNAKVSYKTDHLRFDNITGQYGVSRYTGQVGLDLDKKRIQLNGQIPFMELKDVQNIFQRKMSLPVQAVGTGTGQVQAEGPLRFQDLSYDFRSSFFRGSLAKENFDELSFHVKAKDGLVKSEKILLTKASGQVDVKGQITPTGEADVMVTGRGLRLEQSENVLNMGLDLQGLADFTVLVRGQLPHPRVELNGRLSKMVLADHATEDSVFKLNFLPDRVEGTGHFLGNTVVSDFTFPYDNEAPFQLKLKTTKWDFTSLFSSISRSARQIDFDTAVSMDVQLQAAHGGFWASSGQVRISELEMRKGAKSMVAPKPMVLNFRQGTVNSENCMITSGDSYLKLDVADLNRTRLNASLNGKLDLDVLGLFTPFISDLRGFMNLSMDLKGSADNPRLNGSAYIDKGYAKFTDFYHPFSNVRADILFNDNQVVINSVRSDVAGGKLSGDGKVTFNGPSRPIDAKGNFSDVTLNIPDGFKSKGSGTVFIHGDRFPYAMDIVYDVSGGDVVSEFNDMSKEQTVKASAYLPHFLDQAMFHPFNFNLDVNLVNPVQLSNSRGQASITGRAQITGTPDRLNMTGTFTPLPGAKVFFNDQAFEVASAYVEYNHNPPNDPKIYLTANARVSENVVDEQGRASTNYYDVNMLVQGRGQSPQFTLTSQPPLGQREIVSLLALGVSTGGSGTGADVRNVSENQSANTSAAIGGAILNKAGVKQVKDALGVDVKVSSSQPTSVDTAAQPKVTLSKQWTPNFGASASSTIETSPNNNVKLEYKLSSKISVVGSWDGREAYQDEQNYTTRNVFGLDLQYKMQFK